MDVPFPHQDLCLAISVDNPSETPLSTCKTELFYQERVFSKVMVEKRDKGWQPELEKEGMHQVTEILENYGIDSEMDLSVLDQDDYWKQTIEEKKGNQLERTKTVCIFNPLHVFGEQDVVF
jgi:hypothetical protein